MAPSCFDPNLASAPTRVVPVARIVDLLIISHASERVEEYRQAMLRGDRFPPISVLPVFGWFLVTDGHKRFTACKALGATDIPVEIWGIGRSIAHLGRQTLKEAGQGWRILTRLGRDPEAGLELKKFFRSRVIHYRRLGRSLWTRIHP